MGKFLRISGQGGNVMLGIFAAIGMVAAVGAIGVGVVKGPVRGMATLNERTATESGIVAATAMIANASVALPIEQSDCDEDGYVEALPYKAAGTSPAPVGGGLIPDSVGANKTDAWRTGYGYCVWDPGEKSVRDNVTGCGGTSANRLNGSGADYAAGITVALISAGPDKVFQSSCVDWSNDTSPIIVTPSDSDDIVRTVAYPEFMVASKGDSKLKELPDEACTPQSVGVMRLYLGVVQVCVDTGWEEVGTSAQADGDFVDETNATLNAVFTSNKITFTGFLNTKRVMVTGAAALFINDIETPSPANIVDGDQISLRASAAATPETTTTFSISVSGLTKTWNITTRNRFPAALAISPSSLTGMDVVGPATTAYGAAASFTVTNTGEIPTLGFTSVALAEPDNFEIVTNGCTTYLKQAESCTIVVRPVATSGDDRSTITNSLTATAGGISATASPLTGFADGWSCARPWGGARIPHGTSVPAYATSSVAYNATCAQQTRTCTGKTLSGTYTHQTCAPVEALDCTLPWGGTLDHGSTIKAYATSSVAYNATCSEENRTCTNGVLSGSYTYGTCAPATPLTCTRPWGGTMAHGASITAYAAASVPFGGSCSSQGRTCTNGNLSGSYAAQSCTVAAPTYAYGAWSGYGACSATCGGGSQTRTRACLRQDGVSSSCSLCGGVCSQNASCNTQACCVTEGPHFVQWTYYWNDSYTPSERNLSWAGQQMYPLAVGATTYSSGGWTYIKGSLGAGPYYYSVSRTNCY